jgi:hypothetical protein
VHVPNRVGAKSIVQLWLCATTARRTSRNTTMARGQSFKRRMHAESRCMYLGKSILSTSHSLALALAFALASKAWCSFQLLNA